MFTDQFVKEHPEVVKEFQELIVDEVPPLKCYLRHVVARQCHETTDLIHKIKAPTLVIVGSRIPTKAGPAVMWSPPKSWRRRSPTPSW